MHSQHLPPPLPRHVAYVGWYTWLIRTPANLSVTLGSSNEVTVLRNLPIPCSNPRLWIPQVAIFLFFAPPPPRCARSGQFHGVWAATLTRLLVALGSSNETTNTISTP